MSFKKNKIKEIYSKNAGIKNKNSIIKLLFKIFIIFIFIFFVFSFLAGLIIYKKYLSDLPSVKELENLDIAQASTIYDREGNELYKVFKEKRTYITYENINKNMINAIVAGEDKRYWNNPGIDIIGIARAGINYIIGKNDKVEGTSTITQQLIRNTIISQERKVERKIKELYLAYKLSKEVSKEKVLELYLNKISFGSNSFGIEQASQTFFGKKASDLGILESSILASIPKGPTYYSPYNNPDRLLGYPFIKYKNDNTNEKLDIKKIISKSDLEGEEELIETFKNFILNLKAEKIVDTKMLICNLKRDYLKENIKIDKDNCSLIEYSGMLNFLNSIQIETGSGKILEYEIGRKDFILGRMLEDGYINFSDYKKSIVDSITFEFSNNKEVMKYPHFVFYVREYLEKKYSKDVVESGGLKIYTTLDPKLQNKAQEIIDKSSEAYLKKYSVSNTALISIDNKSGQILSMIGGKDYNDENGGNNNIITSKLQPGSTFKPFVYSLAMYKEQIGTETPIYDVETNFPGYKPKNFDGGFMGKMTISTALDNSRNIPAIKMFYKAGGEVEIEKFMEKLGVKSLKEEKDNCLKTQKYCDYGAPMALGTGPITPLELASAYTVFANLGEKVEINPILKIVDSRGNVIEEFVEPKKEQVIGAGQAYLINNILSNTSKRPSSWNSFLTLKGRPIAAKTGTSTKQFIEAGVKKILPRNLWTIGYTPQISTVVWAGNTSGKEVNYNGDGLNVAGPIMRDFMEYAHIGKPVENWKKPNEVKEVLISSISGLLPSTGFNPNFTTKSLFLNPPISYDNSLVPLEVDELCNGKISENTPLAAIKKVNLVQFHSLMPDNLEWERGVQNWVKSGKYIEEYGNLGNIVFEIKEETCERSNFSGEIEIKSLIKDNEIFFSSNNFIEFAYRSPSVIKRLDILLNGEKIQEIALNKKSGVFSGYIKIPKGIIGNNKLTLRAVDNLYYSNEETKDIIIESNDNIPPEIKVTNPIDLNIKLYNDEFFNLRAEVNEKTNIRSINIYKNSASLKIGITDRNFVYKINGKDFDIGNNELRIDAVDNNFNIGSVKINVEVIQK